MMKKLTKSDIEEFARRIATQQNKYYHSLEYKISRELEMIQEHEENIRCLQEARKKELEHKIHGKTLAS